MIRPRSAALALLCWPLACSSQSATTTPAAGPVAPAPVADAIRITRLSWDVAGPTGCDNPLATDDVVEIYCNVRGDGAQVTLTLTDVTGDCSMPPRGSRCSTAQGSSTVWSPPRDYPGHAPGTTVLVTCRAIDA